MSTLTDFTHALAIYLHDGQVDKQGEPYIEHLERVAQRVSEQTSDENVIAAAWLHDSVEDRHIDIKSIEELLNSGVAALVKVLSRHYYSLSYQEYIATIATYPDTAVFIKLADLEDNLDPSRGPIADILRLRYEKARQALLVSQIRYTLNVQEEIGK
jgi:(p)ppGpp synthase/HD superfamily hydrolase